MLILLLYSILAAGYKLDDPLSSVLDDEVWQNYLSALRSTPTAASADLSQYAFSLLYGGADNGGFAAGMQHGVGGGGGVRGIDSLLYSAADPYASAAGGADGSGLRGLYVPSAGGASGRAAAAAADWLGAGGGGGGGGGYPSAGESRPSDASASQAALDRMYDWRAELEAADLWFGGAAGGSGLGGGDPFAPLGAMGGMGGMGGHDAVGSAYALREALQKTGDDATEPHEPSVALSCAWFAKVASAGNAEAESTLRAGAQRGIAECQYGLGMLLKLNSIGAKEKSQRSILWFRKAAEQGHAQAQFSLALSHEGERYFSWMLRAADQGVVDAQFNIGVAFDNGESVPHNHTEACRWFKLAATIGDAESQYMVGQCHEQIFLRAFMNKRLMTPRAADGVVIQLRGLALSEYDTVAESIVERGGGGGAEYWAYNRTRGIFGDEAEGYNPATTAYDWYSKSAAQGNREACFRLGRMHEFGLGAARDCNKAARWYLAAGKIRWLGSSCISATVDAAPSVVHVEVAQRHVSYISGKYVKQPHFLRWGVVYKRDAPAHKKGSSSSSSSSSSSKKRGRKNRRPLYIYFLEDLMQWCVGENLGTADAVACAGPFESYAVATTPNVLALKGKWSVRSSASSRRRVFDPQMAVVAHKPPPLRVSVSGASGMAVVINGVYLQLDTQVVRAKLLSMADGALELRTMTRQNAEVYSYTYTVYSRHSAEGELYLFCGENIKDHCLISKSLLLNETSGGAGLDQEAMVTGGVLAFIKVTTLHTAIPSNGVNSLWSVWDSVADGWVSDPLIHAATTPESPLTLHIAHAPTILGIDINGLYERTQFRIGEHAAYALSAGDYANLDNEMPMPQLFLFFQPGSSGESDESDESSATASSSSSSWQLGAIDSKCRDALTALNEAPDGAAFERCLGSPSSTVLAFSPPDPQYPHLPLLDCVGLDTKRDASLKWQTSYGSSVHVVANMTLTAASPWCFQSGADHAASAAMNRSSTEVRRSGVAASLGGMWNRGAGIVFEHVVPSSKGGDGEGGSRGETDSRDMLSWILAITVGLSTFAAPLAAACISCRTCAQTKAAAAKMKEASNHEAIGSTHGDAAKQSRVSKRSTKRNSAAANSGSSSTKVGKKQPKEAKAASSRFDYSAMERHFGAEVATFFITNAAEPLDVELSAALSMLGTLSELLDDDNVSSSNPNPNLSRRRTRQKKKTRSSN